MRDGRGEECQRGTGGVSVNVADEAETEKTGEEGPEQGLVTWSPH